MNSGTIGFLAGRGSFAKSSAVAAPLTHPDTPFASAQLAPELRGEVPEAGIAHGPRVLEVDRLPPIRRDAADLFRMVCAQRPVRRGAPGKAEPRSPVAPAAADGAGGRPSLHVALRVTLSHLASAAAGTS